MLLIQPLVTAKLCVKSHHSRVCVGGKNRVLEQELKEATQGQVQALITTCSCKNLLQEMSTSIQWLYTQ